MLTKKEYRLNIWFFQMFSFFCILPVEILGLDVRIATRKRWVLWCLLLMVQVLYVVAALWFMLNKIVSVGRDAIPTLTLDYTVIGLATVGMNFGIQNFIHCPDVAQFVLRSVKVCEIDKCERKGDVFGYTYLEIYTMLAPLGLYPAAFGIIIPYYVIYIWPITEGFPTVIRIVLIFPKTILVMSFASLLHFGFIIHITFMERVELTVKTQLKQLEKHHYSDELQGVRESVLKLRALQVEMNAFNESQKSFVFVLKMAIMGGVTLCGFTAIQFFHINLLMGVCNILLVIESTFAFGFSYNKGFSIPRSIQRLQRAILFHVRVNRGTKDPHCMVLSRQIKSVRKMAVSVGNFHYLQRVSTPNFVDFSVKNMVRLAMFYRRHNFS